MIQVISNCIHDFFLFFAQFFHEFFEKPYGANYLLPGLCIGIAISAIFLGIKIIQSVIWRS